MVSPKKIDQDLAWMATMTLEQQICQQFLSSAGDFYFGWPAGTDDLHRTKKANSQDAHLVAPQSVA
jgi:hypothetical protein